MLLVDEDWAAATMLFVVEEYGLEVCRETERVESGSDEVSEEERESIQEKIEEKVVGVEVERGRRRGERLSV